MAKARGKKARGFFDYEFRQADLKKRSNPLGKLNKVIAWDIFRPSIEAVFSKAVKGVGGSLP